MTLIRRFLPLLFTVLLTGSVSTGAEPQSCSRPANRPFRVFNATLYVGTPDLSRYGIEPIHVVDRGLWPEGAGRSGPPDPALVRRYVESLPRDNAPIVLDIEHYDLTGSDAAAQTAVTDLRRLAATFRAIAPDRRLGYYAILPISDFGPARAGTGSPPYRSWQRQNDRLRSLQGGVDFLFPSAYTDTRGEAAWVTGAAGAICEARRLSAKPVYIFIWPEYHDSTPLIGRFLEASFWRLQLETAYRMADGVVIWGGYDLAAGRRRNWDPQAPWFATTLTFLRERLGRRFQSP